MFELMKLRNFVLYGIITLIIIILGTIFIFGEGILENESIFTIIMAYLLLGVFPILWFLYQFKRQQKSIFSVMSTEGLTTYMPKLLLLTFTLIIFALGAFWLTSFTLAFVFPSYVTELLQEDVLLPDSIFMFILTAVHISFIGPVVEEFIFRGLLLKRLGSKFNIVMSIIITNILFGILHSDIVGSYMFGFILFGREDPFLNEREGLKPSE